MPRAPPAPGRRRVASRSPPPAPRRAAQRGSTARASRSRAHVCGPSTARTGAPEASAPASVVLRDVGPGPSANSSTSQPAILSDSSCAGRLPENATAGNSERAAAAAVHSAPTFEPEPGAPAARAARGPRARARARAPRSQVPQATLGRSSRTARPAVPRRRRATSTRGRAASRRRARPPRGGAAAMASKRATPRAPRRSPPRPPRPCITPSIAMRWLSAQALPRAPPRPQGNTNSCRKLIRGARERSSGASIAGTWSGKPRWEWANTE